MATDEYRPEDSPPRPERRMSTGMKILLVLLAILGGFTLLCCGAFVYIASGLSRTEHEQPEAVREVTRDIVEIDVPDRFQPRQAMTWNLLFGSMKASHYELEKAEGELVLMEFNARFGDPEAFREQMGAQMGQQTETGDLEIQESETRRFTIRGEEIPFTFAKAVQRETDKPYRLVTGNLPGREGVVVVMLQVEEEAYDEDEVVEMLKSIE